MAKFRKTRELVTGHYINQFEYVLVREDGSIFLEIGAYTPFRIANQIREWLPEYDSNTDTMWCRKYRNNGEILEEFELLEGFKGLWAITSGAARNGVWHYYQAPKGALEEALQSVGANPRMIEHLRSIDVEVEVGGLLCHHATHANGFHLFTDGNIKKLTEPKRAPMDHFNQYHRGCDESTYKVLVTGGTYVLQVQEKSNVAGTRYLRISKIIITRECDELGLAKLIKRIGE